MSGYVDLPIDNVTNDLAYEAGKIKWVKGDDEVMQRVKIRLRRIFGEWFMYYTAGIPYFNGQMLGSNDYDYTRLTIREVITATNGVTECQALNLIVDTQTKKVSVYAEIRINANVYQLNEEL